MKRLLNLSVAALTLVAATAIGASADATVGAPAPALTLKDTHGKPHSLADYKGKYVVLEWTNFSCPFVRKHYDTGNMQATQRKALDKGAVWLSVNSSAEGKEGNLSPDEWNKALIKEKSAATAVLLDPDGTVGKAYGAKTTPHMFVIDPSGKLIYKGAIDDKPTTDKDDVKGAKNYVLTALDEAMGGKPVSTPSTTSYGCGIKYK
jgi:peroxiredoxin